MIAAPWRGIETRAQPLNSRVDASDSSSMVRVGQSVLVCTPGGMSYPGRVERVDTGSVFVRLPADALTDLAGAGLPEVDLEYSRPGDAAYRLTAALHDIDIEAGMVVVRRRTDARRLQNRQHFRLELELRVRLVREAPDGTRKFLGVFKGLDLSAGGMAVMAGSEVDVHQGSRVTCQFQLATRKEPLDLTLDGEVVRRGDTSIGISFVGIPDRVEQALVAAIHWHLTSRN